MTHKVKSLMIVFVSFIGLLPVAHGQDWLSFYADVMVNANEAQHRLMARDSFQHRFDTYIAEKGFTQSLADLPSLAVSYAPDSSFRVVSWQIEGESGTYEYNSYLQTADGAVYRNPGKRGRRALDMTDAIPWSQWAGALVYQIHQIDDQYFLFTFRYLDQYTKVKTVEHLLIDEGARLGSPIFEDKEDSEDYNNRLVLEYSADAYAALDYYDDSQRIVYGNLITVMGRMEGQGPTAVPDGSYRALAWHGDHWEAVDRVFAEGATGPARRGGQYQRDGLQGPKK